MFKNTLTPKVAKKFGSSREDGLLPPVIFENGSIHMSFTKDVSAISKKPLNDKHANSSMLDSTILKGLNRSGDRQSVNYRSAYFGNSR